MKSSLSRFFFLIFLGYVCSIPQKSFSQSPPNDFCNNAVTINLNSIGFGLATSGTSVLNATQSLAPSSGCAGAPGPATNANDVWFEFTATHCRHRVALTASAGFDPVLEVRSGNCNGSFIACADGGGGVGGSEVLEFNTNPGDDYLIRVYHYSMASIPPSTYTFNLGLVGVDPNDHDITISNAAVSPGTVTAGSSFSVSCNQNYFGNGGKDLFPSFRVTYNLSTDCQLDGSDILLGDDISSIGCDDPDDSESANLTIPANTPPGNYFIIFNGDDDNDLNETNESNNTQCIPITVTGISCSYSISPNNTNFSSSNASSDNFTVSTSSSCAWNAQVTSGGSWLSITSGSSGTGNGTVNFSVTANTSSSIRTGTIQVDNQTHTVTQPGQSCQYNISANNYTFPNAQSASNSFTVTAGSSCNWNAQVTSGGSWLSITSGSSGNGNGAVSYTASANSGSSNRTAVISVAGKTHTVTQPGQSCQYTVSPLAYTFPNAQVGNNSFSVSAGSGCNWQAQVTSGGSWLTITSGSSGSGNGTVTYTASTNPGSSNRSGSISIGGQTHTITQPGATPTTSVQVVSPNGGQNWQVGSTQTITANISGNIIAKAIEFTSDGGQTWQYVWGQTTTNTSLNYLWTVPNQVSSLCKVRITIFKSGGGFARDESDTFFTISVPANGIGFDLNPTLSHLYWPYPNSTWQVRNGWIGAQGGPGRPQDGYPSGNQHGENGHRQGDYYADDWNNTNGDCNKDFYAPLSGTVIYVKSACSPFCSSNCTCQGAGCCCGNGFGNNIVIQSDIDPDYAFRAAHFSSTNVTLGQYVNAGDLIGQVGMTGKGSGSHIHAVLHKNINDFASPGIRAIDRLKVGQSCGLNGGQTPNNFAANFIFDAVQGGAGGGEDPLEILLSGTSNICQGDSVTLTSSLTGTSYLWNTGETTQSITVTDAGTYTVSVTESNGGVSTSEATIITVDGFLRAQITLLDGTFCKGDTLILSGVNNTFLDEGGSDLDGYLFSWSTGENTPTIKVTNSGNVSVTVSDPLGCGNLTDQIQISLEDPPAKPTIQANGNLLASSGIASGSYQWNLDGNPIPGATGQFYTADTIGFFTVTVTNSSGCSATSDPVLLAVSIDREIDGSDIFIYPNPTKGTFTLKNNSEFAIGKLVILDMRGKMVKTEDMLLGSGQQTRIDVSQLPSAVYTAQIYIGGRTVQRRIIKVH
ncbi:MAG: T9SS type A sorting domain-containing protein [Bacteroidota bacterium]